MQAHQPLIDSGFLPADARLSADELALLSTLTAEELEALTLDRSQLNRPDRKGVPTFHVVF